MQYLDIADTVVSVQDWQLGGNFSSFERAAAGAEDIRLVLRWEGLPAFVRGLTPVQVASGQVLYTHQDSYYIAYSGEGIVSGMSFARNYAKCTVFADPAAYDRTADKNAVMDKNVGVALRRCLIGRLSLEDGLMLHSAGIQQEGRAIAFSGPSKAGKSTQAELWRIWRGATILDGDNCVLRYRVGKPRLYGLPWCGNSGLSLQASAPLEAIVFLEQAAQNGIVELSAAERVIRLITRCFLPMWERGDMMDRCLAIAQLFCARVHMCLLRCLPDHGAVELLTQWLQ